MSTGPTLDSPVWHEGERTFVWAHRGASALAPENTIAAFLLAAELGADGVELDVQLTRDGVPVVLHDPWLWSNGNDLILRPFSSDVRDLERVPLANCDWAELAHVPVVHPDGGKARIPRFEDVLDALPAELWIDVELKAGWRDDPRLVEVALSCISRRSDRVVVSSFDHVALREVADAAPEIPLLAICHARLVEAGALCASIPATMICVDRPFLTRGDVERWRDDGLEVSVGGSELLDDLDEVCRWPVAAVFLDDPRLGATAVSAPSR